MKNSYKAVLLTALGLAAVSTAQAQIGSGNVALGFNDYAGPSSAQNDLVINLGSYTQFTPTASLTFSGSTLDGGNFASDYSTAFGADSNAGNNVAAGVIGSHNPTTSREMLSTFLTPPSGSASAVNWRNAANNFVVTTVGEGASFSAGNAVANGWTYEVAQSPTVNVPSGAGVNGTVASDFGKNPLQTLSGGSIMENLYESTQASSGATPSTWTEVGTFDINTSSGTVTFEGIAAVPEPDTYGLVAAAGLLIFSLRNKFSRKQA